MGEFEPRPYNCKSLSIRKVDGAINAMWMRNVTKWIEMKKQTNERSIFASVREYLFQVI